MFCAYCDSYIAQAPDNGICPHCGAPLPKPEPSSWASRAAQTAPPPQTHQSVPPVYQQPPQVVYQAPLQPGINSCGRCNSRFITFKKRGFSIGLGILGFFLLPVFGVFLGFCGSKTLLYRCQTCGHKWKH